MTEETTDNAGSINPESTSGDEEKVAYSSYKKLLTEKKNLQSRLAEKNEALAKFESAQKDAEEKQLLDDKKYQELLLQRDKELESTRQELGQWQNLVTDSRKIAAFTDALGAKVESKYHGLIPLDKIELDAEGQIDGNSLASAVDYFKKEHARLIIDPKKDLPSNQPHGGQAKISIQELEQIGREKGSKEMLKNIERAFPHLAKG